MKTPSKPNVLFLEDDADTRELVKFTLEQSGINVISAETVAEARALDIKEEIDLFLLDGLIPHGDSIEFCRDLRELSPTKPIVFYSGLAYSADIQKGIEAGATAYLVKPYSGDLAEEILRYIHKETPGKPIEPVFLNKEIVLDIFKKEDESANEVCVRSVEFPASFDRAARAEPSQTPPTFKSGRSRIRNSRITRAAGGII